MRVYWDFTKHCNLNCVHCYNAPQRAGARRDISRDEKANLVKRLAATYPNLVLHLVGGEPTISPDFRFIVELSDSLNIPVEVTTNGTVLNSDIKHAMNYVRKFYISIDGYDDKTNDQVRGEDVFSRAFGFISAVKQAQGLQSQICCISYTVTSHTVLNPERVIKLIVENNISELFVSPVKLLGNAVECADDVGISAQQYFNFVVGLAKFGLGEEVKIHASGGSARFKEYVKWNYFNDIVDVDPYCGSAKNQLRISSMGDILPCASGEVSPFYKRGDWKLGSPKVQEPLLPETLLKTAARFRDQTKSDAPDICRGCEYLASKQCYGGCPVKRAFGPAKMCEELLARGLNREEICDASS